MADYYDISISSMQKSRPDANCRSFSNMVLLSSSFGVPLVLLWLSYRALTWIRSAFEEGSKVIRRYTLLTDISPLPYEADLIAQRTYVMNNKNKTRII